MQHECRHPYEREHRVQVELGIEEAEGEERRAGCGVPLVARPIAVERRMADVTGCEERDDG